MLPAAEDDPALLANERMTVARLSNLIADAELQTSRVVMALLVGSGSAEAVSLQKEIKEQYRIQSARKD